MTNIWSGTLGALMLLASMHPLQSLPTNDTSSRQSLRAIPEADMILILQTYNTDAIRHCNAQSQANWDVQTHVGDATYTQIQVERSLLYATFRKEHYDLYFKEAIIEDYTNEDVRRQLKFLKDLGSSALSDEDLAKFTNTRNAMTAIYNSAKICPYTQQDCESIPNFTDYLTLDPEIEVRMAESRDYDELLYLWTEWREKSGKLMREDYKEYVSLINQVARLNGFTEAGEMWRGRYEEDNFEQIAEDLWVQVEPLYNELHTYVKLKLEQIYKDRWDTREETIPAHILGNMWAQSWANLYEDLKPFKDATLVDVTGKMLEQGYTILKMFEDSDQYYQSLGLGEHRMSYTPPSIIEKPEDRIIACHASAWDFCNGEDFRIKMCTKINNKDYNTVHHEMGHINYYLHYKDLPLLLRGGANPGFHEAVGDAISLAVETPQHLQVINLLDNYADSEEDNINALFSMALERVAFLPFGYLIDKWRWDVFRDAIPESQWNSHWWALRRRYQKISPPVERSEEYFDPGAKYHIPADSQYMSYFTARILQFQFYKAMCIAAGQYDENNPQAQPLHKCNFYQSTAAGDKLKAGLQLGTSKHWSESLQAITGSRAMDASALLEYFKPLEDFLKIENKRMRDEVMQQTLNEYDVEALTEANKMVHASWDVSTNIGNTAIQEQYNQAVLANAQFDKEKFEQIFQGLNPDDYADEGVRRQLLYLTKLGINILPEQELSTLTAAKLRMENTYSDAKICPFTNRECNVETDPVALTLDPEISEVMAKSTNYDELEYVWQEWREKSGKLMRDDFRTYIDLSNRAARENGFSDYGDMWRFDYEDPNFIQNMENLWNQVEPLYSSLHTYVRHKLIGIYGSDKVKANEDLIPAHLLGNMWAQSWVNLYDRTKPFEASVVDVTQSLLDEGYTALKMFEVSNEFFMSLGLPTNEMSYTGDSIIEKPTDRVITCHASAWDFYTGEDFRVKMCTSVNMEDFITVHHEMGHIAYFIQYKEQPAIFRGGANPGFHEAVGDLIALSVASPTHLQKIGLLKDYADTMEDNINALYQMALERVAFLPFGLLIDKWRWNVFSGAIPETSWNTEWWNMRKQYQKVEPPNGETRGEDFFDAGAKFHVPADSKYMSYFVAHILEFQLHKAMCITAGQYDPNNPTANPLHKCDIHGQLAVGEKLHAGLSLGLSKHWSEALREMTGETELSAAAILEYFQPLQDFLKEENQKYLDDAMKETLDGYNTEALIEINRLMLSDWAKTTNIGNSAIEEQYNQAILAKAQFDKEKYEQIFKDLNENDYADEGNRRQLLYLTKLGINVLPDQELSSLTTAKLRMESTYSEARICPFTNTNCNVETDNGALTLEPEITDIMATSTNYDELAYVWKEWREKSGKLMRNDFRTYVDLSNRAARENGFADYGEMWRFDYEDPNFIQNMENLWTQVEPLYSTLHTYVRHKLIDIYGSDKVKVDEDMIPAHLLGNMWAQSWINIYDRIKPFDASVVDVTQSLVDQGYTALKMFEVSNEFFMSLGLPSNEMSYTGESIIEKPTDRVITCHASAWDFYDGEDFRVKMCTSINMEDFITVHHEMGHIAYDIQYKEQPAIFRGGANPGFHEAVGDLIALSVASPIHLQKIGLLKDYADTLEDNINALFQMALKRVAFLPFGLLIDKWRWNVFSGAIPESQWNAEWWNMRKQYQKVEPPNGETRGEDFFDPGAKFHVPSDYKYMSYFVAHILEFQLHKAMCITAGQYNPNNPTANPLHKCDIHGELAVGDKIRAGLSLGLSKHWSEALFEMTGERELSAAALLEYFSPLVDYLEDANANWQLKEETTSNRIPVIVGSVIGSLLGVCIIGYVIYVFRKKRIAKKQVGEITPDEKK